MRRWALIVGAVGAGKSTAAARVATMLAERGIATAGFVQEAVERDGARFAYRARRLHHEDAIMIARKDAAPRGPGEEQLCSFVFDLDAFATARRWLDEDGRAARVLFLDEVSKLEVAGKGHHDAITDALGTSNVVVLAVRADQLFYVVERFGLDEPIATLDAGPESDILAFVDALVSAVTP